MRLRFTKMHGLGNDFVVIDAVRQAVALTAAQVRWLAHRHLGVGCDQVLLVERPQRPDTDFRYRIFNADGGEVAQCGNGARCFARFVRDQGLIDRDQVRVETSAGILQLSLLPDDQVSVTMGIPRWAPPDIPLATTCMAPAYALAIDGSIYEFGAVSMGNPHAVLRVADIAAAPVLTLGPRIETHAVFPQRANVGFAQPITRHYLRLRVWERGVGETLACGSGACAATVIGIIQGWLDSPVRVDLPGGQLTIEWAGETAPVLMRGPATTVFEGELEL